MLIIRVSPTRVHVESGSPLPSGSTAAPEVTFRLDDSWAGYAVTAVFEGNDQTRYLTNLADGVAYAMPWECVTEAGVVTVRVFGVNESGRATTLPATLQVFDSGLPGAMPAPPTPTAYEQYVNAVQANADRAEVAAASAESDAATAAEAAQAIGDIPAMRQQAAALLAEAGDAATAAAEAAESATQTAADIAALTGQAGDLLDEAEEVLTQAEEAAAAVAQADARIRALEGLTRKQDKQLVNLFALHTGHELSALTDSTVAAQKTVPADVLPYATLSVIGGQSAVVDGAIIHRKVNVVLSQGDSYDIFTVPNAILALEGYGVGVNAACYNAVDLARRRFIRRIGAVDMGQIRWQYETVYATPFFWATLPGAISKVGDQGSDNGLCAGYTATRSYPSAIQDGTFTLACNGIARHAVALRDDSFQGDAAAFKAAMSGRILYYELEEAVETDLSGILSTDDLIGVEPDGIIYFYDNNVGVTVPSTVIYTVRGGAGGTGSSPSA